LPRGRSGPERSGASGSFPRYRERDIIIMINSAQKRGELIKHLEDALALADEIQDGQTGFLIERALDEARSHQFRPIG
jgi:hypothetical protein